MVFLLILLVSVLTCASQILQKLTATANTTKQRIKSLVVSLILLGIAMLFWLAVLRQTPVSIAYPLLSLNYLIMALARRKLWNEKMTAQQWQGLALIIIGIICIGAYA